MFDLDNWKEILHTLGKNKMRTFLTALGVFWGIFMLVIMLGSSTGLKNGVTDGFKNFASNSVFIWSRRTTKPYAGFKPGRSFELTLDDANAIRKLEDLEYLAPRNQLGGYRDGNNVTHGTKTGTFNIMADYPAFFKIDRKELVGGRYINELDIKEKRKVVVIGNRVREILFGVSDPIGEYITINGIYFKVVGHFQVGGGRMAQRDADMVIAPFTTFQSAFNYGNSVSWFAMTAKPNVSGKKLERQVREILQERHKVAPDDEMAFGGFNSEEMFGKMNMVFSLIDFIGWFVGILTLIAGIVGVSNIMIIIIKERTKEIGVRRALGATPREIIIQIMMESIVLSFVAGYMGLVCGVLLLESVPFLRDVFELSDEYYKNPAVDFSTAIKAVFVLVFAGALAGLIPANRALKIKPIEALRSE